MVLSAVFSGQKEKVRQPVGKSGDRLVLDIIVFGFLFCIIPVNIKLAL